MFYNIFVNIMKLNYGRQNEIGEQRAFAQNFLQTVEKRD
jgi:hypothetical protein